MDTTRNLAVLALDKLKSLVGSHGREGLLPEEPVACRLIPAPKHEENHKQLTIRGCVHPNAERFELNLLCGTIHPHEVTHGMVDTQIPMHCVFHFGGGIHQLVLNSYQNGDWGREDMHHHSFERGQPFEIVIKHFEDRYELLADGKHLAGYTYRLCPKTVNYVQVCGDVQLEDVCWSKDGSDTDGSCCSMTTVHGGPCNVCGP